MRHSILTPVPPVVIVRDQRSYDPAGHAERMRERRRERDRLQKARRYAADQAFRERKKEIERARYEADPESRRAKMRVENLTPEQVERARARARERNRRERAERLAYARRYRSTPEYNAGRRAKALTKAILREVCDLLRAGPARPAEGRRRYFDPCPHAELIARADGGFTAIPSRARSARGRRNRCP